MSFPPEPGEKVTKVISEAKQPVQIELNKTTKGYTWSIKVYAEDENQALFLITTIDEELQKRYGNKTP
jgi:hypothetical protein